MKKLLTTLLCAIFAVSAFAQETNINFQEDPTFKNVLKQAKKENKYIFMDCYTTWCGPCKMLARNVFTKAPVADFFNENFINVKYDMEKGEGIKLKEQFNVTAFPTLLWLDGEGNIVHKVVGAGNADYMLAQGKLAADPQTNLAGLTKRYESGERNSELLSMYIDALKVCGETGKINNITVEFIENMTAEDLAQEKYFAMVEANVTDPLSAPMQLIYKNKPYFIRAIGADRVNALCDKCMQAYTAFVLPRRDANWKFNTERWKALQSFYQSVDDAKASEGLAVLEMVKCAEDGNYVGVVNVMRDVKKYNLITGMMKAYNIMYSMELVRHSDDQKAIAEGIKYIDEILASWSDPSRLMNLLEVKARLHEAAGDTATATATRQKAMEAREEYVKLTNGRAMIIGNVTLQK